MSRRTRQCIGCDGRTRHKDRRCARCRKLVARVIGSGELKAWFMPTLPLDFRAPTMRELEERGVRLPVSSISWRGRGG